MKNCFIGMALGVWMGIVSAGALAEECKLLVLAENGPPFNAQDLKGSKALANACESATPELAEVIARKVKENANNSDALQEFAKFSSSAYGAYRASALSSPEFLSMLIVDLAKFQPQLALPSADEVRKLKAVQKGDSLDAAAAKVVKAIESVSLGSSFGAAKSPISSTPAYDLTPSFVTEDALDRWKIGFLGSQRLVLYHWAMSFLVGQLLFLGAILLACFSLRRSQKRLETALRAEQEKRAGIEQKLGEIEARVLSTAPKLGEVSPPALPQLLPTNGGFRSPPPGGGPPSAVPSPPGANLDQMSGDLAQLRADGERLRSVVGMAELGPDRESLREQLLRLGEQVSAVERQEPRLKLVEGSIEELRRPPVAPAFSWSSLASFERESLRTSWKSYQKAYPRAADLAARSRTDSRFELIGSDLLTELPKAVGADEHLKAACASLLEPVRDFYNLSARLSEIPELLRDERPEDDPRRDVARLREKVALLAVLRHGQGGRERLGFDLEKWVREQFLTFADLFLRVYQQARCDGTGAALEEGYVVVCRVLGVAGLEPIAIELGQTRFDSARHIGRSTVSRPGMPDGTIAGVVKNGFQQVGGQVVQQPEVIVNRA